MSMTTYVARNSTGGFSTRASGTMVYTHAILVNGKAASWHTTESLAREQSATVAKWHASDKVEVVAVEAHQGGKVKMERSLRLAAEAAPATPAKSLSKKAQADYDRRVAAQTATRTVVRDAQAKVATAGSRAIPTEAAHPERQAYLAEVGMDKYRQQYNGGWDTANAGGGAKKAASGSASVAWMDGFCDRTANPGKVGIAAKWSALRSAEAPVLAVAAPESTEEAPATKGHPGPREGSERPTRHTSQVRLTPRRAAWHQRERPPSRRRGPLVRLRDPADRRPGPRAPGPGARKLDPPRPGHPSPQPPLVGRSSSSPAQTSQSTACHSRTQSSSVWGSWNNSRCHGRQSWQGQITLPSYGYSNGRTGRCR